jgi:hypothetical protein
MGLFFFVDEGLDFALVVGEVAQGVENLRLGQSQSLHDVGDGFTTPMEGRHVADCHAQAINNRLTSANARETYNMGVLGLYSFGHKKFLQEKITASMPV